ncbi:MAG: T9SS type A sorting domain-containing protein [Candidatus Azobacteroides sp.]|nr:T9SS type A sorting domain-containing protein [Candidatus Azobacteroides sp.]
MKTRSLPMSLLAFIFACTLNAQSIAESWENSFAEEKQGDNGEGTWVKGTYLWGYVNDDTELNKGFYTIDHETNDTTLHANPVLKGVNDIMWSLKRNYDYYAKLDINGDGKRLVRAKRNVTLESSVISGGIDWITVELGAADNAFVKIILVSAEDNKITLEHEFTPVAEGEEQVKLETAGTAFEEMENIIIRASFNGDSYVNLFSISWMAKENGMSAKKVGENNNNPLITTNPAEVIISKMADQINRVCIFNMLGQVIYDRYVNATEMVIPKKQVPSGAHIIKITNTTNESVQKTIF